MAQKRGETYYPQSWIDYFLIGNVHIIGFGLDPSEMDMVANQLQDRSCRREVV